MQAQSAAELRKIAQNSFHYNELRRVMKVAYGTSSSRNEVIAKRRL